MQLTAKKLFIAQVLAHIATIYWFFQYSTPVNAFYVLLVYFFTGCLGMSVAYHRLLTHRSFTCSRLIEALFTVFATIGLTGSSITWTAAHRQHHRNADKMHDPHSPSILGYLRAQWGSMYSAVNIRRSPVVGVPLHQFLHRYYLHINVIWGLVLYAIGGLFALTTFYLVPACILWNAGSLINTVCHTRWLGYRRYNTPDYSVNNPLLGVLMWGEGWHNNHHRHQGSPRIGRHWWEVDIGWWIIKLVRVKHEIKT